MKTEITFEGKQYQTKQIFIHKLGWVLIANMTLLDALMDEQGEWVSYEAEMVDEQIYFYVEDHQLFEHLIDIHEIVVEATQNTIRDEQIQQAS